MSRDASKKEQALCRFSTTRFLRCPVCEASLRLPQGAGSLSCKNNHSFDVARQGYLNLFLGAQNSQYDRDLFVARQKVFAAGVYDPLVAVVAQLMDRLNLKAPCILDAGCGEGSFLAKISEYLGGSKLIGLDLARDGIRLATSHGAPVMWLVADLAQLPLEAASVDLLLNVLSPANYGEFRRVLKPEGTLIKVLPGEDYLVEIRERLPGLTPYSNQEVLGKFVDQIHVEECLPLQYHVGVTEELWAAMVQMTPLSRKREILGDRPGRLTIDLQILKGSWTES